MQYTKEAEEEVSYAAVGYEKSKCCQLKRQKNFMTIEGGGGFLHYVTSDSSLLLRFVFSIAVRLRLETVWFASRTVLYESNLCNCLTWK